jgi:hypothetical protein
MKTIYIYSLTALLAPIVASSAMELDQERVKRIEQRFGQLENVEEVHAANLPQLPSEPTEDEEKNSWNPFGETEDLTSLPTSAPLMQPRRVMRRAQAPTDETGWGSLYGEVLADQEKRAAAQLALDEANALTEDPWSASTMTEEEIQREVASRLKMESSILDRHQDPDKVNPLKQLQEYKAMGNDYRSPAQQMLSPDYTQARIAQMEEQRKQSQPEPTPFTPFQSLQQSSNGSTPYGQPNDSYSTTRPTSSSLTSQTTTTQPYQNSTATTQPTMQDLKRLPSLSEADPFEERFPSARRSIWDD